MTTLAADRLLDEVDRAIVDLRSPGEFRRGHIPGASNVPLFDDAERAEIGTLYKQVGREQAVARGIKVATDKAVQIVQDITRLAPKSAVILHCWRGGMRSRGVAWLCRDCGLTPTLLEGGYKAFRRAAHRSFEQPRKIIILAGQTGSGKTHLLQLLRKSGQQVIDLEALAEHRGSVFGGIRRDPQPTVEQFENNLYQHWRDLDPARPVWIEGESRSIGQVIIPNSVWHQMSTAPVVFVEVDRVQRVDFLLAEYGDLPERDLASAIERLKKRLGGARLKAALQALERNDRRMFANLALEYYDSAYLKGLQNRSTRVIRIPLARSADPAIVSDLIQLADDLISSKGNVNDDPECLVR